MSESSKPFGAAGVLVHLFSFGLVAAGIAILFGLASFWLLDRRETLLPARVGGSATEFIYPCSAVAPCTQEHAPIKIDLPSLPDATTPLVRSAQNPTFSDVLSQEPGPRSNFVLLPDQKASAAKQDTSYAPGRQDPVSDKTLPAELGASQQTVAEVAPPADTAAPIVDEEHNSLLLVSRIRDYQPTTLDQANRDAHDTTSAEQPPPKVSYSYYHPPDPKIAFRYRVRKECGPIDDPELRRDCIASFSFHYPRNRTTRQRADAARTADPQMQPSFISSKLAAQPVTSNFSPRPDAAAGTSAARR